MVMLQKMKKTKLKGVSVLLIIGTTLYIPSYFVLRHFDLLIHRAGKYDSAHGIRRDTTHFIEPSKSVFRGKFILVLDSNEETKKLVRKYYQREQFYQSIFEVLCTPFLPLALTEELVWRIIDPNPLDRRKTEINR